MENFGFKKLSVDNWLEPDEPLKFFVDISSEGRARPIPIEEWVQRILEPRLLPTIPEEVRSLFEVARGAMLYGCLFYPLFTLSVEQVSRVAEAAISHKCRLMEYPSPKDALKGKIDWLANQGVLSEADKDRWHAIREFRNEVSHPKMQMILPPGNVLRVSNKMISNVTPSEARSLVGA